jgi:DNA-binding transcriptional LysR family regulator
MDLHQLRIFVTVAEEQNLTRGAQRLYMTPPTVSTHIKALEDELGVTLFVRTSRGMALTDKGSLLKVSAEQTLQAAQALKNHATALQTRLLGHVRLGLSASPQFLRLGALVQALQEVYPGLTLALVASSSGSILQALQQGTMEAGYVFGLPPMPEIATQYLGAAEVVIAVPRQWAARLTRATWHDLAQLPWISSDGYCAFEALTATLFQQHGLRQRQVQAHDEATKAELVAAGIGLAMLERSEAEQAQYAERIMVWPTAPMTCALYFATLRRRQDEPLLQALQAVVQQLTPTLPLTDSPTSR